MAFDNGYTYRKAITIDHTKVSGSADLSNFPVLVSFTDVDFKDTTNSGKVESSSGYDIRFELADGTQLKHEIELYVNTTGQLITWVKIPTLHYATDDIIYIYYGNSSVATTEEDITGTWTAYTGVYHLNEASGGAGAIKDRTSNANHMSDSGSQLTFGATGKINKAISRTNSGAELSRLLTDGNTNIPAASLTVMVWVNIASTTQASNGQIAWQENSGRFRFYTTGGATFQARTYKTTSTIDSPTFGLLSVGTWAHLAIRIPGVASNYVKSYKDGSNTATGSNVDTYIGTNTPIALFSSATATQWFYGSICHFKISTSDLGEDWIITSYTNENDPSTFYALGDEETSEVVAWYNTSWLNRVKITIKSSQVTGTQSDFPVYVNLANLPADFHTNVNQTDARDIRITTSDGTTEVPREVTSYDSATDTGELYFRGSTSSSANTDYYIYYNNSSATEPAVDSTYGAENVWNSNYQAVYHLGSLLDSTSNDRDLTNVDTTAGTGKIGAGREHSGTSQYLTGADIAFGGTSPITVSAWCEPDVITDNHNLVAQSTEVVLRAVNATVQWILNTFTSTSDRVTTGNVLTVNTWAYLVGTYSSANGMIVYVNGSSSASGTPVGTYANVSANFDIGRLGNNSEFFDGVLDEVRISNVDRGADWIATEYNNQNDPSNFFTIGTQETVPSTSRRIFYIT